MIRYFGIAICLTLFSIDTPFAETDNFYVVVNKTSYTRDLSTQELRSLFTLKRRVWSDGTSVQLVTLKIQNDAHHDFIKTVLKLFPYQVTRLWERQVFSGSALSPMQVDTYADLVEEVGSQRGTLGYIQSSQIEKYDNEDVKFIKVH